MDLRERLKRVANGNTMPVEADLALALRGEIPLSELLEIAEEPRRKYFGNKIQVHILDNVRNGYCAEDCGYCAQRKTATEEIPAYSLKKEQEILKEAEVAFRSGAYRFCIVTSGTGPSEKQTVQYADLIRKIKEKYPMRLCLSAGIIKDPHFAQILAEAGLDRYNHNLNTSESHTAEIVTTHTFQDRIQTIENVRDAGISVCSGLIAGMGESPEDLAQVAVRLRSLNVPSIPVNFFLPVPGHNVAHASSLSPDYCLRILCVYRIANPSAEIRIAAGREIHLKDKQQEAFRVGNSLFVSGYLNVKGSDARETYNLIRNAGFEIDADTSELDPEFRSLIMGEQNSPAGAQSGDLRMKTREDLRSFAE